ncbi:MAG: hypothetical protein GF408_04165 [Candidatus Omnitrophica bacterium]|nr:hypothetical protein [Candidatus Omnitrophota bacterium]
MMMLFSIFLVFAAGMFFVHLSVGEGRKARYFPGFVPASFFAGMGVVTMQLFFYHLVGMEFSFKNALVVPLILFILLAARYLSSPGVPVPASPGNKRRWSNFDKFFLSAMVIQLLWVIFQVAPVPVHSHDAVANFALKAKIFFFEKGIPGGFFTWPEESVAHPDYPPMLSLVMTWIYIFNGMNDQSVNFLMPLVYSMFLLLFYSQLKRFFDRSYAILAVFMLATVPQVSDYAAIMYSDLILSAFVSASLGFFCIYVSKRDRGALFAGSMLMGMSAWVKNEAVVFVAAYFCAVGLLFFRTRKEVGTRTTSDLVKASAITGSIALCWIFFRAAVAGSNSDIDPSLLTPDRVMQNVRDLPVLLNLFQQEVFGPKKWNILWVLFFASLFFGRKKLFGGEVKYMTLFLAVSSAGYLAGYMLTTGNNLFFYVNTTISRFMLHFTGICIFYMAFMMKDTVEPLIKGEEG